jgi:hypothetical protein
MTNNISVNNNVVVYSSINGVVRSQFFNEWFSNMHKNLIPKQIIYNDPVTVCIFPDGEKIVVRCGKDEKFIKENGVMACIVKKLFGSRSKFLKAVNRGCDQKDGKNK